jgi:hypothetical protein
VSSIPEVFQYDLTALYAEECCGELKTDGPSPPLGGPGSCLLNSKGEAAIRCVILVATDGLYDMMSNERAVGIAFEHWSDPAAAAEKMIVETGE